MTGRKHYVVFYRPGAFLDEDWEREIPEWDTRKAMALAAETIERHGRPSGFRFQTRIVAEDIPDGEGGVMPSTSKTVKTSGMHYINGKVETLAQVKARATKGRVSHDILIRNMEINNIAWIVTTSETFLWTKPYEPGDCLVNSDGSIIDRCEAA